MRREQTGGQKKRRNPESWRRAIVRLRDRASIPGHSDARFQTCLTVGTTSPNLVVRLHYSVIKVALAPLDIPDAGRVVLVWTENAKRDWHHFPASVPDYADWKASGVFSSLGAMIDSGFNLRLADRTDRINGLKVSPEFFAGARGSAPSRPGIRNGGRAAGS
jgi:hypothetical protein